MVRVIEKSYANLKRIQPNQKTVSSEVHEPCATDTATKPLAGGVTTEKLGTAPAFVDSGS